MESNEKPKWATLAEIRRTILPGLISPIPTNETLRAWLELAGVRKIKANQAARRGGGPLYYFVADVEAAFSKFGNGQ